MAGLDALDSAITAYLQEVQAAVAAVEANGLGDLAALAQQFETMLARGNDILGAISTINSGLNQL